MADELLFNRHVLIVEDIIDTGKTLTAVVEKMQKAKPASIELCALFRRPNKEYKVDLKFWGFESDKFIVGYGIDYDQCGRNLPEVYEKVDE